MTSPPQATRTRSQWRGAVRVFVTTTLFIACFSPPIFVENASAVSRVTWLLSAAWLFLVGVLVAVEAGNKNSELEFGYRPLRAVLGIVMLAAFAAVVLLSIVFANLQDMEGNRAAAARTIIRIAEPFFLWLENFRLARGGLGISKLQIMKVEAIQSLWFIFGVFIWLHLILLLLVMTKEEKRQHTELMQQHNKKHSGASVLFCSLFAILMAAAAYSGWAEFDTSGKCILSVGCYQQNDLAIIIAAGLKFVVIFGFLGGTVTMVGDYFQRRL